MDTEHKIEDLRGQLIPHYIGAVKCARNNDAMGTREYLGKAKSILVGLKIEERPGELSIKPIELDRLLNDYNGVGYNCQDIIDTLRGSGG